MTKLHFSLVDDGDTVELEIRRGGGEPVRYKNVAPSGLKVREPLPQKEPFLTSMRGAADAGLFGGTIESAFEHYIQGQYRAMARQVIEIEKAIKRLEKQQQSITLARKWSRNAI